MKRIALAACLASFSMVFVQSLGCGGKHGGPTTLSISPATSNLTIENGVPPTQAFTAKLTHGNGKTEDVTAATVFSIPADYGDFAGATLTARAAGQTTVQGTWNGLTAQADVAIHAHSVRVMPPLATTVPGLFNAPEDAARAPTVRYPPTGATVLRNMGPFDVHWTDTSGNDVFEISLQSPLTDIRVYVAGSAGDPAVGPNPAWAQFLPAEWTEAVAHQSSVDVQVRGVNSANPTSVGFAPPISLDLPMEVTTGGIYYWASTPNVAIQRHDMAQPDIPAQPFLAADPSGTNCVGCHAISRDGTHMAVAFNPGSAATVEDVPSATISPSVASWTFAAFTPDATEFFTVSNGVLNVRSTATQAVLATMTSAGYVSDPDLSPDGTRLVYVLHSALEQDWSFSGGSIYWRTFNQATNSFGPETALVVDGNNNYYPSYSPDDAWVLFNSAATGASYNNPDAALWVVDANGVHNPIALDLFNGPLGVADSWGRWAPYAVTTSAGESFYWLTVASKRDFGTRLHNPIDPQIWMSPFFPDRAAAGADPSGPGFWLPFQDIHSDNHMAQWTQKILP